MHGGYAAAGPNAQPHFTVPFSRPATQGATGYGFAEAALFIILLYLFEFFTPDIKQNLLDTAEFALNASESNVMNQVFWLGMSACLSLLVMNQPDRFFRTILGYAPLIIFLLFALLSSVWAVSPSVSFRRAILAIIIGYSFVTIAIYARSPRQIFFVLYGAFWCVLLQSLIAIASADSYTPLGEFRGFQNHKNAMGALAGYGIVTGIFIHRFLPTPLKKTANIAYIGLYGLILVLSQSKTAQGEVFLVPALMFVFLTISRFLKVSVGTIALVSVLGIVFTFWVTVTGFGIHKDIVLGLITDDVTFTERTPIWSYVWEKASERWLLGYGHQSFWSIGLLSVNLSANTLFIQGLNQSHNGFLEVWLTLGLVGLLLFIPVFVFFDRSLRIARHSHPQTHALAWALLIYAVIHNLMESTILQGQNVPWCIMILVFVAAERARVDHLQHEKVLQAYMAMFRPFMRGPRSLLGAQRSPMRVPANA